jgi:hypothetical protein
MKIVKQASGKNRIKMSKSEWEDMGKKAGWMQKTAAVGIPAGQFKVFVLQQNDAGNMGSGSVVGIELHYKGDTYLLRNGADLPALLEDLSEEFAQEIQQVSGTMNQGRAENQANLGVS